MHNTEHTQQLHRVGLKATMSRMQLIHFLEGRRTPVSAAFIAEHLELNLVTVYRVLGVLVVKGLVRRGQGPVARYSYGLKPHHHHLVCTDCGYTEACKAC